MKTSNIFFTFLFYLAGSLPLLKAQDILGKQDSTDHEFLMLEFNEPQQNNAFSFECITGKTIHCSITSDSSIASGYSYVLVSADEWKKVFGLELNISRTIGAGNSLDSDSYFKVILNKDNLKPELKPLLKNFYIQNDPKFLIYDKASSENCMKYFK